MCPSIRLSIYDFVGPTSVGAELTNSYFRITTCGANLTKPRDNFDINFNHYWEGRLCIRQVCHSVSAYVPRTFRDREHSIACLVDCDIATVAKDDLIVFINCSILTYCTYVRVLGYPFSQDCYYVSQVSKHFKNKYLRRRLRSPWMECNQQNFPWLKRKQKCPTHSKLRLWDLRTTVWRLLLSMTRNSCSQWVYNWTGDIWWFVYLLNDEKLCEIIDFRPTYLRNSPIDPILSANLSATGIAFRSPLNCRVWHWHGERMWYLGYGAVSVGGPWHSVAAGAKFKSSRYLVIVSKIEL